MSFFPKRKNNTLRNTCTRVNPRCSECDLHVEWQHEVPLMPVSSSHNQCCHCVFRICCFSAGVYRTPGGAPTVSEAELTITNCYQTWNKCRQLGLRVPGAKCIMKFSGLTSMFITGRVILKCANITLLKFNSNHSDYSEPRLTKEFTRRRNLITAFG